MDHTMAGRHRRDFLMCAITWSNIILIIFKFGVQVDLNDISSEKEIGVDNFLH